ncbi:glucosyltransferase-si motif protein [Ranid herpesvirus 3]|uniref:Glucosyltransferase-si motif protein n=1 Tax=Ranid herpesvirus 3 TaxID=1987509 RepID=A0A1X9T572_9VIRU|nr:glucosyltransferase-si motif protein [Ranid herpesvirus 3]ARR28849.1 glucosyltransferase-si motif protein [Ranid herpesvirus 3]
MIPNNRTFYKYYTKELSVLPDHYKKDIEFNLEDEIAVGAWLWKPLSPCYETIEEWYADAANVAVIIKLLWRYFVTSDSWSQSILMYVGYFDQNRFKYVDGWYNLQECMELANLNIRLPSPSFMSVIKRWRNAILPHGSHAIDLCFIYLNVALMMKMPNLRQEYETRGPSVFLQTLSLPFCRRDQISVAVPFFYAKIFGYKLAYRMMEREAYILENLAYRRLDDRRVVVSLPNNDLRIDRLVIGYLIGMATDTGVTNAFEITSYTSCSTSGGDHTYARSIEREAHRNKAANIYFKKPKAKLLKLFLNQFSGVDVLKAVRTLFSDPPSNVMNLFNYAKVIDQNGEYVPKCLTMPPYIELSGMLPHPMYAPDDFKCKLLDCYAYYLNTCLPNFKSNHRALYQSYNTVANLLCADRTTDGLVLYNEAVRRGELSIDGNGNLLFRGLTMKGFKNSKQREKFCKLYAKNPLLAILTTGFTATLFQDRAFCVNSVFESQKIPRDVLPFLPNVLIRLLIARLDGDGKQVSVTGEPILNSTVDSINYYIDHLKLGLFFDAPIQTREARPLDEFGFNTNETNYTLPKTPGNVIPQYVKLLDELRLHTKNACSEVLSLSSTSKDKFWLCDKNYAWYRVDSSPDDINTFNELLTFGLGFHERPGLLTGSVFRTYASPAFEQVLVESLATYTTEYSSEVAVTIFSHMLSSHFFGMFQDTEKRGILWMIHRVIRLCATDSPMIVNALVRYYLPTLRFYLSQPIVIAARGTTLIEKYKL